MFDFGYEPLKYDDSQYFKKVSSHGLTIPVTDVAAYHAYPQYRWMYNKMSLCEHQGIPHWPDGLEIHGSDFPVFRKPITNLYGLSAGAELIHDKKQYYQNYKPGYFLMPYFGGRQFSIDIALHERDVLWYKAMVGSKDENGLFEHWTACSLPINIAKTMFDWIYHHFENHIGVVNLEIIGDWVIESHPRMSTQFIDLYGEGWLENVVQLLMTGHWKQEYYPRLGCSMPILVTEPGRYRFAVGHINEALRFCKSIQIYTDDDKDIKDLGFSDDAPYYRLAVINSDTIDECQRAKETLLKGLLVD